MLNSCNRLASVFKTPLKLDNKSVWEEIFTSSAHYLLSLKTNATQSQFLFDDPEKKIHHWFCCIYIKSTICIATKMFSVPSDPFKYLPTYKFSQDHLELLFTCIKSKGGWNNRITTLTACRWNMPWEECLLRNAISPSKNANCVDFTGCNATHSFIP